MAIYKVTKKDFQPLPELHFPEPERVPGIEPVPGNVTSAFVAKLPSGRSILFRSTDHGSVHGDVIPHKPKDYFSTNIDPWLEVVPLWHRLKSEEIPNLPDKPKGLGIFLYKAEKAGKIRPECPFTRKSGPGNSKYWQVSAVRKLLSNHTTRKSAPMKTTRSNSH